MTVTSAVVGGWIALNAALVVALLTLRRDRPKARAKLLAWVMKGERRQHGRPKLYRDAGAGERRQLFKLR